MVAINNYAYTIIVENPKGNIRMCLRKIGCGGRLWTEFKSFRVDPNGELM